MFRIKPYGCISLETLAKDAALDLMRGMGHPDAKLLEISKVYNSNGSYIEIDAAAYSKNCAVILKAKSAAGLKDGEQLVHAIEFIRLVYDIIS